MIPLVTITNLSWKYRVGSQVLRNINLSIGQGEVVGLVGRSGCGKSTLGLCLNGIIPQSYAGTYEGSVVVCGKDATTTPVSEMAKVIAMVFQSPDDQLTKILTSHEVSFGLANLGLSVNEISERLEESLKRFHLSELAEREVVSLSGGEKQKVALAAALAMHPKLLVLDEPTTDLDPLSKNQLIDLLQKIKETVTTLIISHDVDSLSLLVDRFVVMDQGQIISDGPKSEVFQKPDLLKSHGVGVPQIVEFSHQLRKTKPDWPILLGAKETVDRLNHHHRYQTQTPPAGDAKDPKHLVIEVKGVSFSYPKANQLALENINLQIQEGESVAIVGNNGSGKTTLSKILVGLLKPKEGEVCIQGEAIKTIRPDLIGYIFQNPDTMLSQMTVRDEIAFTPKNFRRKDWERATEETLEGFDLKSWSSRFPLSLSKGQRQRLAYAAVTTARPPILIFDEPTTGIDEPALEEIMAYMNTLRKAGHTILFITHDLKVALEWADRILVTNAGRIAFDGSPELLIGESDDHLKKWHLRLPPMQQLTRALGLKNQVLTPKALTSIITEAK